MLVVRKRSPFCIGSGDDEMFVASDLLAFAGKTNKMLFLPDESFAFVTKDKVSFMILMGRSAFHFQIVDIPWTSDMKQGYEHFMLKEIYEQKKVIQDTVYKYRASRISMWLHNGAYITADQRSAAYYTRWLWHFMACSSGCSIFL